jgi:hypothetical protein
MSEYPIAEVQQALDDLFSERLLPFKLSVDNMELVGPAEYVIHFHDSRLNQADFSHRSGESFREDLRVSVMESVQRLPGPMRRRTDA